MRFNGLSDVLAYITARKHIYKEKKSCGFKKCRFVAWGCRRNT